MFAVDFSFSDRLYLTQVELLRLADRIRQALVCRAAIRLNDPVVVTDVELCPSDAWQLAGKLEIRNVASPALY